jgi:dehydrogenase/reductase SDR family protein 4
MIGMDLSDMFSLSRKVAIVTGASKGIGLATAEIFAAAGAQVVISSRKQATLDTVAGHLKERGYDVMAIACNVGDPDAVKNMVSETVERYGQIDILVNNAATNPVYGPINETSLDAYDKIMHVNVRAPFQLMKLCFPYLIASTSGSVINISSIGGLSPEDGLGIYSVSKAALISLTKACAKEWAAHGIRVNAICPGLIKTKFSQALWNNEGIMEKMMDQLALKRIGESAEIGAAALYLASNASAYTTGAVLTVDGGVTI